jgi:Na+/H+ antiporter NhaD/arsenite permease-like protein
VPDLAASTATARSTPQPNSDLPEMLLAETTGARFPPIAARGLKVSRFALACMIVTDGSEK